MIRRTSWRHYRHDHVDVAGSAAQWMAVELGWDEPMVQAEIARYLPARRRFPGFPAAERIIW